MPTAWVKTPIVMLAAMAALGAAAATGGDTPAFTAAQVSDGQVVYDASCASCHGPALEGSEAPALAGVMVRKAWIDAGRTVADLYGVTAQSMPLDAPGRLTPAQYIAVTAFMLSKNGMAPGAEPLAPGNMNRKLTPPAPAGPGLPRVPGIGR